MSGQLETNVVLRRPLSITIIGWLFIFTGIGGMLLHAKEINPRALLESDLLVAASLRLLAIVGGIFLLRGADWARWLLMVWTAFHVVLSIRHPLPELITHCVIMIVIAVVLYLPSSSAFILASKAQKSIPAQP